MRRLVVAFLIALVASACRLETGVPGGSDTAARPSLVAARSVPLCEDVERIGAPAERYGDWPIYVANEMPTEEIRDWAVTKPGFEELWIDRDHLGWINVAFSADAEARQAELEQQFPDVGVVAVQVDWTMAELHELQRRVGDELDPLFPTSSGIQPQRGVVTIGVGYLEPDRIAAVEERFAGERVCVEGSDPALKPPDGPQRAEGDGWRLLANERGVGASYRTGIASDQASYEQLWTDVRLPGEGPAVDFESEVVIWFGAVYGSSCPNLRLDDVVVDTEEALVYPEIVNADANFECTADANPYAYVVALERQRLPSGPFAIQLGPDDPPRGVPEERTLVEADLSRPGAVAGPGQVHGDPTLPGPFFLEPGDFVEPGDFEFPYRQSVHCGAEWLGPLNEVWWRTDVPDGAIDVIPPEWRTAVDATETIELTLTLRTDPEPVMTATANGHAVEYRPTAEEPPGCD